jgi:hypothetical protein
VTLAADSSAGPNRSQSILPDLAALAGGLAERVDAEFAPLIAARSQLRAHLLESGEILTVPAIPDSMPESMCAIDGARVREQMYAADLLTAVATTADARSVEVRYPADSSVWATIVRHTDGTDRLAETAMGCQEVLLTARAPHAMRIMDGSFITPLIALREGLFVKTPAVRDAVADLLMGQWDAPGSLASLLDTAPGTLLALAKSDSATKFVADYSARFGLSFPVSDRFLATQVLEPGEMLAPRPLSEASQQTVGEPEGSAKVKRAAAALREQYERFAALARDGRVRTTYFKPLMPGSAGAGAKTVMRFEYVLSDTDAVDDPAIAAQYASIINSDVAPPFMLEPFCQYTVDRQAKLISKGTEALRERMLASLPADRASSYRALLAANYRT